MKFILGLKLGMSEMADKDGNTVPLTLIEAGPCYVTQIKNKEKDGYASLQMGFQKMTRNVKKTMGGKAFRWLRECQSKEGEFKVGDTLDVSLFQEGDIVKVAGQSKGKGFQGVVKKWGFKGKLSTTHGTKHENRAPGSVGCSFPERVIAGKKMAGRMGNERVTVSNLEIVKVDKDNNLLAVRGAVPGRKGALLEVKGK